MKDERKTKAQLIQALAALRQRVADLEAQAIDAAEEALRASQEYVRNLIDSSLDMIIAVDPERRIVEFNRAAEAAFGYQAREIIGQHIDLLYTDRGEGVAIHRATIENGRCARRVLNRRKNGQVFPSFLSASVLRDASGELIGVMGVSRDVTEQERKEAELHHARREWENIFQAIGHPTLILAPDHTVLAANQAAVEATGESVEALIGMKCHRVFHSSHPEHPPDECPLQALLVSRQVETVDMELEALGGTFLVFCTPVMDEAGNLEKVIHIATDITDRVRAEQALRQRNRELALLNEATRALGSTLDLDRVLETVLEQVRRLLDVTACSVWLRESANGELVCRHVIGPRSERVRGWRLPLKEGLVGWTFHTGESLIVPDALQDEHHFKGVDEQTGLALRSMLSVPLRVKNDVIGVLQVVDTQVDRFKPQDLALLEPLSAGAAIAIENARLYAQARRDAETLQVLLREVNHRVKNNLTGIVGMLYAARDSASVATQAAYRTNMDDLIGRVRGLATVHEMLSAARWTPLRLDDLVRHITRAALRVIHSRKRVTIDVSPAAVRVTPDEAHDLAMVFNELMTNAVKYGLGERDAGRISVEIVRDGEWVQCEFRDDGPGYPDDVLRLERYNVGFDLIQTLVRHDLGGELSLRNDGGAVAVIRFKVVLGEEGER